MNSQVKDNFRLDHITYNINKPHGNLFISAGFRHVVSCPNVNHNYYQMSLFGLYLSHYFISLCKRPHTVIPVKTFSTNNNPLQQPSIHNQINFHSKNFSTQLACPSSNSLFWKKTTCHTNCRESSYYISSILIL